MLELPVKTSALAEGMPHRPPMVWIDEVVGLGDGWGECRVRIDGRAHYLGERGLRPASAIEFMAQAYGYVQVARAAMSGDRASAPKRAYLVGFREMRLAEMPAELPKELLVRVDGFRVMGPIAMFRGEVRTPEGAVLASGNLKVFGE